MTELEKLRALLVEARREIKASVVGIHLVRRIDAALAEPVGSAQSAVEWRNPNNTKMFFAECDGADLEVQLGAERWHWEVSRYGDCATEDEAKATAEKAAKGQR